MKDLLFADQRQHPMMYDVNIQGRWERTVSIRIGVSWPGVENPGYYVLVAQLEPTEQELKNNTFRLLAFGEGEEKLLNEFFEQIRSVCNTWRIDSIWGGDEIGEESFAIQLWEYLDKKHDRYEIIQRPEVWKSFRSKQPNFLVQLVRNFIGTKRLIFSNIKEGHTPHLIERVRNTDMEANILEVPELKALAHVMDDFDCSPWNAPE